MDYEHAMDQINENNHTMRQKDLHGNIHPKEKPLAILASNILLLNNQLQSLVLLKMSTWSISGYSIPAFTL